MTSQLGVNFRLLSLLYCFNCYLYQWNYELCIFTAILALVYGTSSANFKAFTGTEYSVLSKNAKELNEHHSQLLEIPVRIAKWLKLSAWTNYAKKLGHNLTACKFCHTGRIHLVLVLLSFINFAWIPPLRPSILPNVSAGGPEKSGKCFNAISRFVL